MQILVKIFEDFDNFEFGIPINKSEFLHSFLWHFMESTTRCKFEFSKNLEDMYNEKIIEYNMAIERHFYVSIVKALGIVCTDRKRFD